MRVPSQTPPMRATVKRTLSPDTVTLSIGSRRALIDAVEDAAITFDGDDDVQVAAEHAAPGAVDGASGLSAGRRGDGEPDEKDEKDGEDRSWHGSDALVERHVVRQGRAV